MTLITKLKYMDLSSPTPTTNSPLTPVFGDNVQDLLSIGALHVNPSAIITVNSIDDTVNSSPCVTTLRDAINQANADGGEDLIVFDRELFSNAQTITLNLGELDITHNLDIIAPRDSLTGGDLVTVSGNKASRVFEIETGAMVSIDGLIVANGNAADDNGGGIKNFGTLALDNSIVRNNSATPNLDNPYLGQGGFGGGIYNQGTLTVSNSTISSNGASQRSIANGGGIYNTGTAKVLNSTLDNNSVGGGEGAGGGGIFNAGNLLLSTSTLNNNSTFSKGGGDAIGGGIYNAGTANVSNSTISGNSAGGIGGGIRNEGTLEVSNSTISGNSAPYGGEGGGIYNARTANVSNSTISGNSAFFSGGGIRNEGTLEVSNSTLSGNTAPYGGGIFNGKSLYGSGGTVNVSNSTLSGNTAGKDGGGVFSDTSGSTNVRNTIIALNLLNENAINPDVSGTFSSNGYNLIGDRTGSTGFGSPGDIVGTSDNPIDPRLAPLDFNGGSTQNFALLPDSPAIDAGDPTLLDTDPTTDQRGFPRVSNGRADIGAFEVQV